MSDVPKLTDERLAEILAFAKLCRGDAEYDEMIAVATELVQYRSALAVDMERVRSVVETEAAAVLGPNGPLGVRSWDVLAHQIATRVTGQLATARPMLSEEDREHLRGIRDRELTTKTAIGHLGGGIPESCDARVALLDRLLGAP